MSKSLALLLLYFLWSINTTTAQQFSDPLLITLNQEHGFTEIDLIADGKRKFAIVDFLEHKIGDQIFFNDQPVFEFEKEYPTSLFNSSAILFELSEKNEYLGHQVMVDSSNFFKNLKIRQGRVLYQVDHTIYTFNDEKREVFYDLKLENAQLYDFEIRSRKLYIAGGITGKKETMKMVDQLFENDVVNKSACQGEYSNDPNFYARIDLDTDHVDYFFKENNKCKEAEVAKIKVDFNGTLYGFTDYREDLFLNEFQIDHGEEIEISDKDSYLFRVDKDGNFMNVQTYNNNCEDNIHTVIPHRDGSYTVYNYVSECEYYGIQPDEVEYDFRYFNRNIYIAQYDIDQNYLWHNRIARIKLFLPNYFLGIENSIFKIAFELHKRESNDNEFVFNSTTFPMDTVGIVKVFDFDANTGELIDSSITIQNNHLVHLNDAINFENNLTYNLTFFEFHPSITWDSLPDESLPLNEEVIVNIVPKTISSTHHLEKSTDFVVYPNPIRDEHKVYIKTTTRPDFYKVYDQVGKEIYSQSMQEQQYIELPELNKGIYWFSFYKNGKLLVTEKVIKL